MQQYKLFFNDTNSKHQEECIRTLSKHYNVEYRKTYNGNLEVILVEKATRTGRPKKQLPPLNILMAEKKKMTFKQMCEKYNVCRTTLYKILRAGSKYE